MALSCCKAASNFVSAQLVVAEDGHLNRDWRGVLGNSTTMAAVELAVLTDLQALGETIHQVKRPGVSQAGLDELDIWLEVRHIKYLTVSKALASAEPPYTAALSPTTATKSSCKGTSMINRLLLSLHVEACRQVLSSHSAVIWLSNSSTRALWLGRPPLSMSTV